MTKEEVVENLENIIEYYSKFSKNDVKYAMAAIEAIKALANLKGWNKDKPESTSGIGGTW